MYQISMQMARSPNLHCFIFYDFPYCAASLSTQYLYKFTSLLFRGSEAAISLLFGDFIGFAVSQFHIAAVLIMETDFL